MQRGSMWTTLSSSSEEEEEEEEERENPLWIRLIRFRCAALTASKTTHGGGKKNTNTHLLLQFQSVLFFTGNIDF